MPVQDFVKKFEELGDDGVILIITAIFVVFCIILIIKYIVAYYKVKEVGEHIKTTPELGKVYKPDGTSDNVNTTVFEQLLLAALQELRTHLDIITGDFYGKSVDDMLKVFPTYTKVLEFSQYYYKNRKLHKYTLEAMLKKNFGDNYNASPQLVYEVPIQVDPFTVETYKRSLLSDLSRAQVLYEANKDTIDAKLASQDKK